LGKGSFGTVYLAEHLTLKGLRAIKCQERQRGSSHLLLKEAKLLINLNHPGIPKVYDIIEDENAVYMIMEYVQGESLEAFLLHQEYISTEYTIWIGLKLCEILIYLRDNQLISHRDIKPDHIILQEHGLKLIDFGNSNMVSGNTQFYGTEENPDSDYQAVCKIILELLKRDDSPIAKRLTRRINQDLLMNEGLDELYLELTKYHKNKEEEGKHLCRTIAIAGSENHIGVTHIAVSLESYLVQKGLNAMYQEMNSSKGIWKMAETMNWNLTQEGNYETTNFAGMPFYGPGVGIDDTKCDYCVMDYGNEYSGEECDVLIIVLGSRLWERKQSMEYYEGMVERENVIFICSYGDEEGAQWLAGRINRNVYLFPLDKDPFHMTQEKYGFFDMLWSRKEVAGYQTSDNCGGGVQQRMRGNTFMRSIRKLCSIGHGKENRSFGTVRKKRL